MKKLGVLLFVVAGFTACSSAKLAVPTQVDIERAKEIYPDYSLADLKEGQALYVANCGSCHGLKNPTARNAEQWGKIVPDMVLKVNKKGQKLDAKSESLILKYVTTMSTSTAAIKK
jgi:cytochrome c